VVFLKKTAFIICFLIAIRILAFPCYACEMSTMLPYRSEPYKLIENTKEIIYRDIIISLLLPYMQKEINNYYKEYLTELPIIFPYSVDIVNVEREGGSGFLIKLEVIAHPFVGPINTVGDDRMIIETGGDGSVKIKKFQHIKSYQLPSNWQYIIKKPY